jgi:magnesium chelatase family protein
MLATVHSGTLLGIDATLVQVEVDVASRGLPKFTIVGLPEEAVRESRERIRTALANSGFKFPQRRITVNLAPAYLKKLGTAFDLPIALGIVASQSEWKTRVLDQFLFVGELALDGQVRPVRGVISLAMTARDRGVSGVAVPRENAREAAVVEEVDVRSVPSLAQAVAFAAGGLDLPRTRLDREVLFTVGDNHGPDLREVKGQAAAKRALEIAAAGNHNLLLVGPPGSGKTMLARRIPSVLPPLSLPEALETTRVHSIAGILPQNLPLVAERPFRAPHHHVSNAGLIGGGSVPKPGEISLAHNGVLFLDELTEFRRQVLEQLRQPLEERQLTVARAGISVRYPASVLFVGAMNPCPCGYLGATDRACTCEGSQILRYRNRLSGPLLDRIDLHVEVTRVPHRELARAHGPETDSETVQKRVIRARGVQKDRFQESGTLTNAHLTASQVARYCRLDEAGERLLEAAFEKLCLSARAWHRILKVGRTIADLDGQERILPVHIAEAIQYRILDRDRM